MKTAKVKNIQQDGKFKELFKFEVELDNGESCSLYKKTENPYIKVGEEVKYTTNDKGTMKIVREAGAQSSYISNSDRELNIVKQSCLKAAVETVKSNDYAAVLEVAEIYTKWVMNSTDTPVNKKPEKLIIENPKKETTDLPF